MVPELASAWSSLAGLPTEESYEGDWVKGHRHGFGVYRYKRRDGTVYEVKKGLFPPPRPYVMRCNGLVCLPRQGEWVNDVRHGQGILRFKDGSYFKGRFEQERMTGEVDDRKPRPNPLPWHRYMWPMLPCCGGVPWANRYGYLCGQER